MESLSTASAIIALPAVIDESCIDEIIPGLFLGNAAAALNKQQLFDLGVTHVVTAAVSDGFGALFPSHFQYLEVLIEDNRDAPIATHLPSTADFIDAAMAAHGRVFVHCKVGTSRSASIVLHFLVAKRDFTLLKALRPSSSCYGPASTQPTCAVYTPQCWIHAGINWRRGKHSQHNFSLVGRIPVLILDWPKFTT